MEEAYERGFKAGFAIGFREACRLEKEQAKPARTYDDIDGRLAEYEAWEKILKNGPQVSLRVDDEGES